MRILGVVFLTVIISGTVGNRDGRRYLMQEDAPGSFQALHAASRAGNAIEVERIISQGVNPNRASSNGTTPLMIAALNNRRSVIEVLISSGCNVDAQNPDGATALWLAAEMGNADIVEYIAAKGGTVDALDKKGVSPLLVASKRGHFLVVKKLISMGADLEIAGDEPPMTPLCEAASHGYEDIMSLLVDSGADVNGGSNSRSPLGVAAMVGRLWAVKFLMQHGADINLADTLDGSTPLHMASKGCQLGVAVWMLDKGATAATKDRNGNPPVTLVCTGDLLNIKPHEISIRKRRLQEVLSASSKGIPNDASLARFTLSRASEDADVKPTPETSTPATTVPLARSLPAPSSTTAPKESISATPKAGCFFATCEKVEESKPSVVRTMDETKPLQKSSTVNGMILYMIVSCSIGLAIVVIVVYLFGVRRIFPSPSERDLVAALDSDRPLNGGVDASVRIMTKLPKEVGQAEMLRLANTPLAVLPDNPPSSGGTSAGKVPPLQIKEMMQQRQKTRKVQKSQQGSNIAHQSQKEPITGPGYGKASKYTGVELGGLKRVAFSELSSGSNDPPTESIDINSRKALLALHQAQQYDADRLVEMTFAEYQTTSTGASPEFGTNQRTPSIYAEHPQPLRGSCRVIKSENPLFKGSDDQEHINDFDSFTDHSETAYEYHNERRLSLTGSF